MKNQERDNFVFRIVGIELLEYSLKAPTVKLPESPVFNFNTTIEHKVNIDAKLVVVSCAFSIQCDNSDEHYGIVKVGCVYELPTLEKFISSENSKLEFPDDLVSTLNSISISTSRGVMFALFRGTFLHNAILPIVDPKSFVQSKR